MKIIIQEPPKGEEESIILNVREMTANVVQAINILKSPGSITVYTDEGEAFMLPSADVFYAESVDLKTFVYSQKYVYRSKLKLYELEELLSAGEYLRISKQVIVNVKKIRSVAAAGSGRFQATMLNGEKLIISRQYVPLLKERLGL